MMDYSNKGILVMLQDLQRTYFGWVSINIQVVNSDVSKEPILTCGIFDENDEPHTATIFADMSEEEKKAIYLDMLSITCRAYGQKYKERHNETLQGA